ncbi:MAG: phosphoenolpyruvate synthase [Bacteroidales bacterium]|nr:phosphoenolpyruvate synthase [Bacteroidales bacterium]
MYSKSGSSIYRRILESRKYYFHDTAFDTLMQNRINKVLLISSNYDAFMLEEDGRIDEQIFNEYVSLNLRHPPIFVRATTAQEAFRTLKEDQIDLVISMLSISDMAAFDLAKKIKQIYPNKPIVVLTQMSREVSMLLNTEDFSAVDYVFSWLGNSNILLAIIKLIEDKMNVDHDVKEVGVQTILLVEDSIRFYSIYLPEIYRIIFKQALTFMEEAVNQHQKMLRMRGRPKILLARSYEEAIQIYKNYSMNILGVISDISYKRNGEKDPLAGIKLTHFLRKDNPYLAILLQSSEIRNEKYAHELNVGFLYKYSKNLSGKLRRYLKDSLAFGDFVFKDPKTMEEIDRASNLRELQKKILTLPDEVIDYHSRKNSFSRWLNARSLFQIAQLFRPLSVEEFDSYDDLRHYMFNVIASYRQTKGRGVIAKFDKALFDDYLMFSRIGEGSIGGKARGLAFIDSLIKRNKIIDHVDDVLITIPRTVVISTDIFDEFMEMHDLYDTAFSTTLSDEEILKQFVNASLPTRIHDDLKALIEVVKKPLAVRSSSVLEDSHYQPFAGIYTTYMLPHTSNKTTMLKLLANAIKSVYASVYYASSKAYMEATKNSLEEEKMGIVIQEVCGEHYGDWYYPTLSGVARSVNFYPMGPEKPSEGVANVALGLGKTIVDGEVSLRFSPKYPKKVLQLSSPEMALRDTQKNFYALDLSKVDYDPSCDEAVNLVKLSIRDAEKGTALKHISSTYDLKNNVIKHGTHHEGKKLITFAGPLQFDTFPLAKIVSSLLETCQKEMNTPVEIEFAANLDVKKGDPKVFSFLQVRPIVESQDSINVKIEEEEIEKALIYSQSALGNGVDESVYDIIYVKPEVFDASKTKLIAEKINAINQQMSQQNRNYILVGPGRWGSSDPWLGVPVKWAQISMAKLIIESGLKDYRIDPSQGTHFFQNLTSFRVGYFTLNPYTNEGRYDTQFLNEKSSVYEDEYIRQVRFRKPIVFKIDGKTNKGIVLKPED